MKLINKIVNLLIIALFLANMNMIIHIPKISHDTLMVHFLDVDQGDSTLLRTKNNQLILIDGGPGNNISKSIEEHLHPLEKNIHLIIVTHPDKDHIEGILQIAKNYTVDIIAMNKSSNPSYYYFDLIDIAISRGIKLIELESGIDFEIDKVAFKTIWPYSLREVYLIENSNDTSISNYIKYNDFTLTVTGDITSKIEETVFENLYNSTVIKAGHHGSNTSTSPEMIYSTNPKIAVVSAGKDNSYGHPHKDVIEILTKNGIDIYRTDQLGTITIKVHKEHFEIFSANTRNKSYNYI